MVDSCSLLYPTTVLEHTIVVEDTVRPLQRYESLFDGSQDEKKEAGTPPRAPTRAVVFSDHAVSKPSPPAMPRPTLLGRSVSAPASNGRRRAIFGQFWDKPTTNFRPRANSNGGGVPLVDSRVYNAPPPTPCTPPSLGRSRVSSISIPDRLSPTARPEIDIVQRQFSTPSTLHRSLSREHFRNIRELSLKTRALPTVPLPLSRFCDEDGKLACMGGAYPLVSPRSILRQSSYRTLTDSETESLSLPEISSSKSENGGTVFNLTRSVHMSEEELLAAAQELHSDTSSTHDGTSTSSNCSSHSARRRVQFDPRITVTEYADDYERKWFSEDDLDRFKNETICLAQQYLLKHPDMIAKYNKPVLDPVTGTMRKKALFSLPVFRSAYGDDDGDLQFQLSRLDARRLANSEVKKILIVDRNRLILDLFRRSLRSLFPHAAIACYQSAEEALQSFESVRSEAQQHGVPRGFDIVVAEERLHQPLAGPGKNMCSGSTTDSLPLYVSHKKGEGLSTAWKSLSSLSKAAPVTNPLLSGSQLFRKIIRANNNNSKKKSLHHHAQRNTSNGVDKTTSASTVLDASSLAPIEWRPLLIGVSTRPQQDSELFLSNGADLVWGKPPPTMNECLRDHLVATLLKKRGKSAHRR